MAADISGDGHACDGREMRMRNNNNELIYPAKAVYALGKALRKIDNRLIDHGERVAYLTCKLNEYGGFNLDTKKLFILSLFHDIGAYKTEEIDRMLEFESNEVTNHSVYGYLFLKHMSPLEDCAEAVLYHHSNWVDILKSDTKYKEYATLIKLCDRIDVALVLTSSQGKVSSQIANCQSCYKPEFVKCALDALKRTSLLKDLNSSTVDKDNLNRCEGLAISENEALEYLKLIVYSIDFRSELTVTHTINTISLALDIAQHFGLEDSMCEKIKLGALLHDVGKLAIPLSILEHPGRLSTEQMAIMKTHVDETKDIIDGIVNNEIRDLALAHHEKLDGSGYPLGITAQNLSFPQRIIAVADIVSALSSRRSYKEPFPKERIITILREMEETQLDAAICDYVCDNYDLIVDNTEGAREQIIRQYNTIKSEYEALISH